MKKSILTSSHYKKTDLFCTNTIGKECKYPSLNEENRSSAFSSIEHDIFYKFIDVPKWYMYPISPQYSTNNESEYCKSGIKELTTWCVKENKVLREKINALIKK